MRNFSLQNKATIVKTLKEPPRAKKKFNYERAAYVILLTLLTLWIAHRVYKGYFIIQGNGQIRLGKTNVEFTDDIRLQSILVVQGDTVAIGDTLFYYKYENFKATDYSINSESVKVPEWILREKMRLKKEIAVKKISLKETSDQIKFKKEELEHKKELILLGVDDMEKHLTAIQSEMLKLNARIESTKKEIYFLKKHLASIRSEQKNDTKTRLSRANPIQPTLPYKAPIDGIVGRIHMDADEVCYEKENVLTIHQKGSISIQTYFDLYEVNNIERGDKVWVTFPDGSVSEAIINNFFISTYRVPEEFQKKYEPTERNIVAEVIPINESETENWFLFYKMDVQVSKYRFDMPF